MATLEYRDPRTLHSHLCNYRAHLPEQTKQAAFDFGQYENIVITPDGVVVAGHGVVQAAIEAGKSEVAVYVLDGDDAQLRRLMAADPGLRRSTRGALREKFGIPPFSVLDARQGYWQERKRAWMDLGIQSELGRE